MWKHKALGFAVAAAYWPGMLAGSFVPRWAVIAAAVPMVSSLDPRNIPASLRWVLIFLVFCGAASLLESPYPMAGVQDLLFIVFLCGSFLLGAELTRLDDLMKGLGFGLVVSSVILVAQKAGILTLPHDSVSPAGLFFNSEILGEFAALVFVWAIISRQRWLAIAAILPVVMVQSRVGLLSIGVALFYAYRPASWKINAILLLLLTIISVAAIQVFGVDKLGSASHRITLWGTGIASWRIIGHGLGWGSAAFPYEQFVHSDVIQAIAELGVAALALVSIPFIAFRNSRGNNAERALFVAVCVEAIVSFPLHFPATGFVAAIVAGYLVSYRPLVFMGDDLSGTENGFRGERRADASPSNARIGGWGYRQISVRPIHEKPEQVYS